MYTSDFNLGLTCKIVNCFSEISLDDNILKNLHEKLKENNNKSDYIITNGEEDTTTNKRDRIYRNANNTRNKSIPRTSKNVNK